MIQIIVVTASILLGLILYPTLAKAYTRFITGQYKKLAGVQVEKSENIPSKTEEKPSIIGKSKFNLSQSKPNTATDLETEKGNEKESIFAPETGEEPAVMDVDVPLERVVNENTEINLKEEEEDMDEMIGPGAVLASGVVFDELIKTKEVIEKPDAGKEEEQQAGKVLSENRNTVLVGQMMEGSTELAARISYLIDIQDKTLAAENEKQLSKKQRKELAAEDFNNFDINSIF